MPITTTIGLRFGFKIKSHKFLWEHLKNYFKIKTKSKKLIKKNLKCLAHFGAPNLGARGRLPLSLPPLATPLQLDKDSDHMTTHTDQLTTH